MHVPFKWVSAKTQMLIQFNKDENWRAIGVKKGGVQFLKKSVGYDPIFATGIDGANVLLTHLPADNNVTLSYGQFPYYHKSSLEMIYLFLYL